MTAKITGYPNQATVSVGNQPVANLTATSGLPFCKNKLFNGEVTRINQRGFDGNWATKNTWASGNTIAQQELCYGYDMWAKASATDMLQVIEAGNFRPSTVHTLSGIGVTTQQITSPASGNWVITVPQTARNVQVEEGVEATPFEIRPTGFELAQCQRYYETGVVSFTGYQQGGGGYGQPYPFKVTKRTSPAVTQTGTSATNVTNPTLGADTAFIANSGYATATGVVNWGCNYHASAVI